MRRFTLIIAAIMVFSLSNFAENRMNISSLESLKELMPFSAIFHGKSEFQTVELIPNKSVTVEGSLKNGKIMESLGWASRSSTACFPATQNLKFNGNHVLFVTNMPPHSILKITVKPKKSGVNLSIYGYQLANNQIILPKDLERCTSCEAEHKWDYPKRGKTQDDSRTISLNSIGNPYSIVVGITGANGLTEGDFTLEFSLEK